MVLLLVLLVLNTDIVLLPLVAFLLVLLVLNE